MLTRRSRSEVGSYHSNDIRISDLGGRNIFCVLLPSCSFVSKKDSMVMSQAVYFRDGFSPRPHSHHVESDIANKWIFHRDIGGKLQKLIDVSFVTGIVLV